VTGSVVRTDVVVVGAGFTGLSAAQVLSQAGIDFIVMEARDRVGGRVEAMRNGLGELIDSGGQFVCDDMPELMAVLRSRGKTLVESHVSGALIAQPAMSDAEARLTYAASMAIRDRVNAISPDDPAIAGLSVAAWLARQDDPPPSKSAFQSMVEGLWCLSVGRIPLWYLIDNDRRVTNEVSELQYFVAETMHSLADDLARDLGDRVWLGSAVTRIDHGPNGVRLTLAGARSSATAAIEARSVIVSVPPMTASGLEFKPPLPAPLRHALGVWQSGSVIKVLLRYDRPFWRERGLSGMVMWREPAGLFAFDMSKDILHPMLGVFVGGPLALRWAAYGASRFGDEIISKLTAAFGPEAGDILDFTVRNWISDRWSGGAYSDLVVDMHATDAEKLVSAGAPPVYFASSELSPSFPGYIEGAIVAGRAAAAKCIASL
jgi:monoamine oxidase